MPSDPTGRNPIGILARSPPDFFDDNLGLGAAFFSEPVPGNTDWYAIALYNNDSLGRYLKVYTINGANNGGVGTGAYFLKGTIGTLQGACSPGSPDLSAPPGQIWTADLSFVTPPTPPNPFLKGTIISIFGTAAFDGYNFTAAHPLAIVPAGYSYVLTNLSSSNTFSACFWYHVANE